MSAYSFLNVSAGIIGPGGAFNIGAGAANADEGITVTRVEPKNVMTIGADGKGQHSLMASDAYKVKVKLLKTSIVNGQLMTMYNLQSSSSTLWGINTIAIKNSGQGDVIALQSGAFTSVPENAYSKEAGFNEWEFDFISGTQFLGQN